MISDRADVSEYCCDVYLVLVYPCQHHYGANVCDVKRNSLDFVSVFWNLGGVSLDPYLGWVSLILFFSD